ncbi:class I SAM-dependent methyltransferase [Brevibacillus sp. NRS-1366]|uniref:class I SAM-dependent methyltransferase n=1 Tax=Brevibacillus sp. NRS-1366 TaxID=3233899 RepID=UPI003D1B579C
MSKKLHEDVYEQVGVAMTCRSYQEYVDMFSLTTELMEKGPILDVGAGASSFTAEANQKGLTAIAVDPLYDMEPHAIYIKGKQEIAESTEKLARLASAFHWDYYGSLDRHQKNREDSLERFIRAYAADEAKKTFIPGLLPHLPFEDDQFSLVVGSHFLFLYHQQFDEQFHLNALTELVRVCRPGGQVRLYPTVGLNRQPYKNLAKLMSTMEERGYKAILEPTLFRFLDGATHYLRISK